MPPPAWLAKSANATDWAATADGTVGFVAARDHISMHSTDSGKVLRQFHWSGGSIQTIACSPHGKLLAAAGRGSRIRLWDTASGKERFPDAEPVEPVRFVRFLPGDKTLLSISDGACHVWDAATGKPQRRFADGFLSITDPSSVDLSPDGRTLAVGGWPVRLWDVPTGEKRQEIQNTWEDQPRFAADSKTLALIGNPRFISIPSHGEPTASLRLVDGPSGQDIANLGEFPGSIYSAAFCATANAWRLSARTCTSGIWPQIASYCKFRRSTKRVSRFLHGIAFLDSAAWLREDLSPPSSCGTCKPANGITVSKSSCSRCLPSRPMNK